LANAVDGKAGLLLENKGLSLALHYRRAPRLAAYAHRLARSMLPVVGRQFCIQRGKYVVEMRPAGKDKGVGIREFMKEEPFRGRTAIFVGDDASDEVGFAAVNGLGGHSIKVGPGRSVARWRLPNVTAVREWLDSGRSSIPTPKSRGPAFRASTAIRCSAHSSRRAPVRGRTPASLRSSCRTASARSRSTCTIRRWSSRA